jgi:dolichyl-phosphate beta-glucosyltransferase
VARLGVRGVADSQCGFKLFTAAAAQRLFGALQTDGYAFDVELLLRAQKAGYRVAEVAVSWADQPGSKVGVLTSGPGMLLQILRARRRVGRG